MGNGMASASSAGRLRIVAALRHPGYRWFWLGTLASVMGFQVLNASQGWLVYDITGDSLALGFTGLAVAVPSILLNLFGGAIADRLDRRKVIAIAQVATGVLVGLLGVLTITGVIEVWHIIVIAFSTGALGAFDAPARQALFPVLVPREDLPSAVALNSIVWQSTRILGPATAGIVVAALGAGPAFLGATVGFALLVIIVLTLKVPTVPRRPGNLLREMGEGLKFIAANRIFALLIGMTFFNSMFGMSYILLMPVFAKDVLGAGPEGFGALVAASGVGALCGTVIAGALGGGRWRAWVILGGAALFGGFLILFSMSSSYPMAVTFVLLAGVCNSTYMIATMTTLQMLVPDAYRGRVMGFFNMTYNLMPLGAMVGGAITRFWGVQAALAMGGALVALFSLAAALSNARLRGLGTLVEERASAVGPRPEVARH